MFKPSRLMLAGAALAAMAIAPGHAQSAAPAGTGDPPPMVYPGWGYDPAHLDPAVKPGDDFNAYVNGKQLAVTEIPPQYSNYGPPRDLALKAERDVKTIVEEFAAAQNPPGSIGRRIGDTYRTFLDTAAIEAAGLAPARPYLAKIYAVRDRTSLAELFAMPGMPSPLNGEVSVDPLNPERNTVFAGIGGYGLPDRDNYLIDNPRNLEMRAKYKDYLAFLLAKAGYADPRAAAEAVYGLEREMAAIDWDRAAARDPELTTNPLDRSQLLAIASGFPLERMLAASGLAKQDNFIVPDLPPSPEKVRKLGLKPEQLAKLGGGAPAMLKLMAEAPLATWQAWLASHFLSGYSAVLPADIDAANFAFYGQYLQGRKLQRDRWRRALTDVQAKMGEAIGKIYVERHFPAASKAAMIDLVANLRRALAADLETLSWMSPETRARARSKLDALTVKIGYPDKFKSYDGLAVTPGAALANAVEAARWGWADALADLAKPVDRSKWFMTPQTVNAYYHSEGNEIVFPAAYLQPPFYNPQADMAVNYGAVGATIGHEISHGFDDSGAKFDGTGKLSNWWSPADRAAFEALGNRLAPQYDTFCPLDSGKTCVNGRLTLGENMADLGGIAIAYRAYRLALGGKAAPVIDGLTGDQRFFIAYAQAHSDKWREAFQRQIMQTNPHAPDPARVNEVLRNFDPWYAAFSVQPGDKLYLPPDQRIRIW